MNKHPVIDIHMHVGLKGDKWKNMGRFSEWFRRQLVFKIMLLYAGIEEEEACDRVFYEKTLETIQHSSVDKVVCLALDHVYTIEGKPEINASHMWVSNDYILKRIKQEFPKKVLFGASIHPYRNDFELEVKKCVENEAVIMKWIPSAQQINLALDKTRKSLVIMAKNKLPLLLHVGMEHAVFSTDNRTNSYNFLSWSFFDKLANTLRFKNKWFVPDIKKVNENIKTFLDEGGQLIFAHCGLPYFTPAWLGKLFEHSDFSQVKKYLKYKEEKKPPQCFADASAICTPFRKSYFKKIDKLPPDSLLFGSDYPTPVFELSADLKENIEDFKAIMKGDFERIFIPEDNLIDVNFRELKYFFPNHRMYTNFSRYLWKEK